MKQRIISRLILAALALALLGLKAAPTVAEPVSLKAAPTIVNPTESLALKAAPTIVES